MVSLSCARKGEPQGNLFTLHYPTGAPSELINFPDCITCILKAHWNLECNDFVPNDIPGRLFMYWFRARGYFCVHFPSGVDLEGGPTVLQEPYLNITLG